MAYTRYHKTYFMWLCGFTLVLNVLVLYGMAFLSGEPYTPCLVPSVVSFLGSATILWVLVKCTRFGSELEECFVGLDTYEGFESSHMYCEEADDLV